MAPLLTATARSTEAPFSSRRKSATRFSRWRTGLRRPKAITHTLRGETCAAFFDFDNTIATFDVLDDLVQRFSVTQDWMALEEAWRRGAIGSKECLDGQLRGVRVTDSALSRYLASVTLDPAFPHIVRLLKSQGIEPVILSDSFCLVIQRILAHHGLADLKVHANELCLIEDRLMPSFPHLDGCARCANCKAHYLLAAKQQGRTTFYVGDGLSDVCAAKHADLLFAKDTLLASCRREGRVCIPFESLSDVHTYLTTRVQWLASR